MQAKRIHSSSRNARDLNLGTDSQKGNPQAGHECAQCGAVIPPGEAKCPYCGSYYEPEAEREYMRNLDQMRSDLDKGGNIGEAITALEMLGYTAAESAAAVSKVDPELPVEDIIKKALIGLAKF